MRNAYTDHVLARVPWSLDAVDMEMAYVHVMSMTVTYLPAMRWP